MTKIRWTRKWMPLTLATALVCPLVSCSDDTVGKAVYNPDKPIVCESFSPKGGPISTQVILTGENFGSNARLVKCYFNEKKAPVIGVNDTHMLVLAPRLPGDNVVIRLMIGSVNGNDTVYQESTFDGNFAYEVRTNISTIIGGDASATEDAAPNKGDAVSLAEAQFKSSFDNCIEVDKKKNIFFTLGERRYCANEEAGTVKNIDNPGTFLTVPGVIYDKYKDHVYHTQSNIANGEYWWYDVDNDFAQTEKGEIVWDNTDFIPDGMAVWVARRTAAMNPADGHFYCRSYGGYVTRWAPETGIGENLSKNTGAGIGSTQGSTYGAVFLPSQPDMFYFSNDDLDCIFCLNLTTGITRVYAGQTNTAGYLDGPLTQAQFNSPRQMCVDSEENIYVADSGNHCIRKINTKTGYVSTIAGIPQSSGYINGTSETAKFNNPIGLAIDTDDVLYVGDSNNHAIRRIAIE